MGGSKWLCKLSALRGSDKAGMAPELCLYVDRGLDTVIHEIATVEGFKPVEIVANLQQPATANLGKESSHGKLGRQQG